MTINDNYCMPVYNNSSEKKMGTFLETYILESMMKIGDKKYESATKLTNKEKVSHKRAS